MSCRAVFFKCFSIDNSADFPKFLGFFIMIDSVKPSSESSSTHVVVEAPSTANERSVVQFNQALSGDTGQSNTGGGSRDENADADNKTPVTAAAPATAAPVSHWAAFTSSLQLDRS